MTSNTMFRFYAGTLLVALSLSAPAQAIEEPGERRALLIGVDRYKNADIPQLNGAVNDVEMMRQALTTRFAFPESRITTLTNEAATRAGIIAAFEKIVADAAPRDVLYVHFSGHGSQAPDTSGDETTDNMDETLIPHDGREPGIRDITDDELAAIFDELKTSEVLLVLDSCHSGSGLRGGAGLKRRQIDADEREALYRAGDAPGTRTIVPLEEQKIILMTGAADRESALDGPIGGRSHGFFSYALAKAFDEGGPGASPRVLHDLVKVEFLRIKELFGGIPFPEPQLEGPTSMLNAPLFPSLLDEQLKPVAGAPAAARPAERVYINVKPGRAGQAVLLGGLYQGATVGSHWAIYESRDSRFAQGAAIATARVSKVSGTDGIALLDPANARLGPDAIATSVTPAPPANSVSMQLDAAATVRQDLRDALAERLGEVRFVSGDTLASFIVEADERKVTVFGAAGISRLLTFNWAGGGDAAERIAPLVTRAAHASALKSLVNDATNMRLTANLVTTGGTRGVKLAASQTGDCHVRKDGETRSHKNSLMLEVESDVDAYLSIVYVDGESGITVLFPNNLQSRGFFGDGLIRAGDKLRVPDSHEEGNRAGFHWDCAPPAGLDTLTVFASTDGETAERIRHYLLEMTAAATARRLRGFAPKAAKLESLRGELAQRGVGLRGVQVVASSKPTGESTSAALLPDWTAVSLNIEVVP